MSYGTAMSLEMAMWSKEETLRLVEIWGDDRIPAQLYSRSSQEPRGFYKDCYEFRFKMTFQHCRDKLKKLKSEYRKLKDKQGNSGITLSHWMQLWAPYQPHSRL